MKNLLYPKSIVLLFISFLLIRASTQAQSGNKAINEDTSKWYNSHVWLNGLQLKPHQSIDQKEFAKQYHANKVWWDKAFEYMRVTDLEDIRPGTYSIDGKNVFAMITEGPGKEFKQGKWESHRHYNDIQCIISGKEKIGTAPVSSLKVTEPYDNSKDIAYYTGKGKYYIAVPGEFFIFFPQNAHRPGIKVNCDDEPIKKIVIKVRTGE